MPEGHTIFRLAADQNKSIGKQILHVTSPQGRFQDGAALLDGRRLKRVDSLGKHLFYEFAGKETLPTILHVHQGLFGKYRTHKNPPPAPRGLVRVRFEGKKFTVDLNGPNQCELLTREAYSTIRARLGPDPLQADAKPTRAWERIHKSRAPIGVLLMDQSIISGIGNIYRTEILHLAKIHPRVPGTAITRRQFNRIWKLATTLLAIGVKFNRIVTVDLKKLKRDPTKMPRSQLFRIFKKAHCPDCGSEIEKLVQAGRKAFACPVCQPCSGAAG
jgi:endonuclease-8